MRYFTAAVFVALGLVDCAPCNDIDCGGFAIEVVADPQLSGEFVFSLVVDMVPVSCVVPLPINANNVLDRCSRPELVVLSSETGGISTFSMVVTREVSAVRVSVVQDEAELGTLTYNPKFDDAPGTCCREAPMAKLSITAGGALVKG